MSIINFSPKATESIVEKLQKERDSAIEKVKKLERNILKTAKSYRKTGMEQVAKDIEKLVS
jgi:hypothetical protein